MSHKLGKGMTGLHHSAESKEKIGLANKNKKRSLQYKILCSQRFSGKGNPMYGKVHPCKGKKRDCKKIDMFVLEKLINMGFNSKKICNKMNTTNYIINNNILLFNSNLVQKLKCNNRSYGKGTVHYWSRGKSYEEIFKSKEKAFQRKAVTSKWMSTERNIRRFCKHPSKPQIKLYHIIKSKYEGAQMEYPIKYKDRVIWLDIAIPDRKINVEYDGMYWHKRNGEERDKERDIFLNDNGWKIIRIKELTNDTLDILTNGGLQLR